ncbi:MAG: hypothetical protein HYX87_09375 [Chloroflexi bacterium]|nr:hypothetical protein [Chloroflexota bacterium]
MASRPYAVEELLSFDRMKRAVMGRVVDAAEKALEEGAPFDQQKLADLTAQEWKAAKEAVRNSPAAREAAREHMEKIVAQMVEDMLRSDKAEMEALGVQEKSI